MKSCPGSGDEVRWVGNINRPACRTCGHFVNYKSVEEIDGWIDVAKRHYPDGSANTKRREGYRHVA